MIIAATATVSPERALFKFLPITTTFPSPAPPISLLPTNLFLQNSLSSTLATAANLADGGRCGGVHCHSSSGQDAVPGRAWPAARLRRPPPPHPSAAESPPRLNGRTERGGQGCAGRSRRRSVRRRRLGRRGSRGWGGGITIALRVGPGRVTELRRGVERQWPRVLGGTPREWGDRKKEADSAEEEHLRVRLRVEAETAPKKVGSRLSIEHLLPLDEILLKLSPVCFVLKRGVFLIPNRGVPRPAPRRGVPLRRRTGEGAGEASERQGVEEACWAPHISAGREVRRKP